MKNPFEKLDLKTAGNVALAIGAGVVAVVSSLKKQKDEAELEEMRKLFREFKQQENK